MDKLIILIRWILSHICNILTGIVMVSIGYFDPIAGVINVMIIAIVMDLILGIAAALNGGEAIQSKKLWRTIYKLFIAIGVVMLVFAVDVEIGIVGGWYKGVALLVIGFEIWSMLESAGKITDHRMFRILQKYMQDRVKETTGMDITNK